MCIFDSIIFTAPCSAGSFITDSECQQCEKNTFSAEGASSCTSCPEDMVSAAGSTSEDDCGKNVTPPPTNAIWSVKLLQNTEYALF